MGTIYYIDSENVGDGWIDLLAEADSRFLVFYTGHSPRIAYPQAIQIVNAANKPEFIDCYEGNNGLDFQLVSYLGYEIRANNSNEMVIVSNDTGFDTVVHFWMDRGINVRRLPRSNASNSQPAKVNIPVSDDECITSSSSVEVDEKICGVDRSELYTIINCIGAKEYTYIYAALTNLYGNENGLNIYKCLKAEKFVSPKVQWTNETRMKKLIDLILKYANLSSDLVPESLPEFLVDNIVDSKKAMVSKLNKAYGHKGLQINKIFSPFYKTLAKIKKK